MASIFERLDNREAFKVEIKGGAVWLREPTFADGERVSAMTTPELQNGLSLALCLVNEDGTRAFVAGAAESDIEFANRVLTEAKACIGRSSMLAIFAAMKTLMQPADPQELAKN